MRTATTLTSTVWLVAICAVALPSHVYAQHSGVEIWSAVCGRCHTLQPPARYTAKDWDAIINHMTINARLTDAQRDSILAFMHQGAMRVSAAPKGQGAVVAMPEPATGTGDSPEAAAADPRSVDHTKTRLGKSHAEDFAAHIRERARRSRATGKRLNPAQVKALARYLRTLGDSGR